jgi:hypothetical protein
MSIRKQRKRRLQSRDIVSPIVLHWHLAKIMAPNLRYGALLHPGDDEHLKSVLTVNKDTPSSTSRPTQKVPFRDVFCEKDGHGLEEAFQSIRVIQSVTGTRDLKQQYHAEVYEVPLQVLRQIESQAPASLAARVADFNGNLLYEMQTSQQMLALDLGGLVHDTLRADSFLGSYLTTESTVPQPAHVDYSWEVLEEHPNLYLGFFPLTSEGMYLQVWPRVMSNAEFRPKIPGEILFIPYGRLLVLPAGTIHAGGFRTTPLESGEHGNLRFHLYLARNGDILPEHQTNKYTEPDDKRRELCERYTDAPGLDRLVQQRWFV